MKIFSIANSGSRKFQSAFTLMEIAISLAVIGIALVAIIGILPIGLRTQRENRERTLINQDAAVFIESIRNGMNIKGASAPMATDLTNYVFAITNYWYFTNAATKAGNSGVDGYSFYGSQITSIASPPVFLLTNDYCIVGLMSTPLYSDSSGRPVPTLMPDLPGGCYSNHIVAYIHSISGLALEKPPQGNQLLRDSSFSYRVLCENVPLASAWQEWDSLQVYENGDRVFYINNTNNGVATYWRAINGPNGNGNTNLNKGQAPPDNPTFWTHDGVAQTTANDTHELRLTFFWPLLPNSGLPPQPAHQTYRTLVTGQLQATNIPMASAVSLFFFQPQIFTNAP